MRKHIILILLIAFAVPVMAQDGGTYEVSWGSALIGALGLAVASWVSGIGSKAKELAVAMMDRWIEKIRER